MKIVVDLVAVNMSWDPDTNTQSRSAVIRLPSGGVMEFEVTEAALKELVGAVAEQPAAEYVDPEPEEGRSDAFSPDPHTGDLVFGGDVEPSPVLFRDLDTDELPEPDKPEPGLSYTDQRRANIEASMISRPISARKDRKAELRARANAIPRRTVPQDEMGNPIVPQRPPTVREAEVTSSTEISDDLFEQG